MLARGLLLAAALGAGVGGGEPGAEPCRSVRLGPWPASSRELGLGEGGELAACLSLRAAAAGGPPPPPPDPAGPAAPRIRVVPGGTLWVEGLTFAAGAAPPVLFEVAGGAATVAHCVFRGYSATAVRVESGSFTCRNCSFVSNAALAGDARGAALAVRHGAATAAAAVAAAGAGGCIQALGGRVALSGCLFARNWAPLGGGAVYAAGAEVRIRACTFDSNHGGGAAGADGGDARRAAASGPRSARRGAGPWLHGPCGGAVLIEGGEGGGAGATNVSVLSSTWRRNRAASGGALCVRATSAAGDGVRGHGEGSEAPKAPLYASAAAAGTLVDIHGSTFEGNEALRYGGAVALESPCAACGERDAERAGGASGSLLVR